MNGFVRGAAAAYSYEERCTVWNFYSKSCHLYFMYGSDMNDGQIRERCSNPEVFAVARLPDHRISFHGYQRTWDGGEETIIPCVGEDTWGVIYKLSFVDAEKLDTRQDVRMDGAGRYFHCPVDVFDILGFFYPVDLFFELPEEAGAVGDTIMAEFPVYFLPGPFILLFYHNATPRCGKDTIPAHCRRVFRLLFRHVHICHPAEARVP